MLIGRAKPTSSVKRASGRRRGQDTLYALADDDQVDIVDCGPGQDVAWLNVKEKAKYVIRGCEVRNWIVPSPEQAAEESGD